MKIFKPQTSVFILFFIFFLLIGFAAQSQDKDYAKRMIRKLCDEKLHGRGYVNDGDKKAAELIKREFETIGLKPLTENYFQNFTFPVVTFPNVVSITVDETILNSGKDFIVSAGCPPIDGDFKLLYVDSEMLDNLATFNKIKNDKHHIYFFVVDKNSLKNIVHTENLNMIVKNILNARGIIYIEDKLTWDVASDFDEFPVVYIKRGKIQKFSHTLKLDIESELNLGHEAANVAAYIEGTAYPDSFMVITAHYDHLGMMGKLALFPGANDNASGIAMLLDIAKHYQLEKPKCSVAFICFAAEEAGLLGSKYYTLHPLFPLTKIKFLVNLDLMGTGENGMTVVNGTEFRKEFDTLVYINKILGLLKTVNIRGKAANSDHYWFSENGVRCFFFYLLGDYFFYHDVDDEAEVLPLKKYEESTRLVISFADVIMGK